MRRARGWARRRGRPHRWGRRKCGKGARYDGPGFRSKRRAESKDNLYFITLIVFELHQVLLPTCRGQLDRRRRLCSIPKMSKRAISRLIHTNSSTLIGPPHPVSNLRPALYNGVPERSKTNSYSSNELRSHIPVDSDKFQLDNALNALDKLNHNFWVDVSSKLVQGCYTWRNCRATNAFIKVEKHILMHKSID